MKLADCQLFKLQVFPLFKIGVEISFFLILAFGLPTVAVRKIQRKMKTFLEVLVDEDGRFHFSTDESFTTEEEFAAEDTLAKAAHMNEYENMLTRLIRDMTEFMWRNRDQRVSQAVRMVAMAEILGCAQPYEHAEEFWSLMMFHTIPQFEKYAATIKRRHGFSDRTVSRPYIGGTLPDGTLVGGPAGGPMSPIGSIDSPDGLSFPIPQPASKVLN